MKKEIKKTIIEEAMEEFEKEFWKMLREMRLTDPDKIDTDKGIIDMEAVIRIEGDFDKYGIDDFLREHLTQAFIKGVEHTFDYLKDHYWDTLEKDRDLLELHLQVQKKQIIKGLRGNN